MSTEPLRVVAYARVSTTEQGQDGYGLDAQRATITAEVERRGWELVEIIEEVASGGKLDRPGLNQALELIAAGDVQALLVTKLDRLSRSVADFAGLLDRFRAAGWGLVVLDLGVDTTTIAGEAMANVMATFAQMERRRIGERTREGMAAAKAKGAKIGRPRTLDPATRKRILNMRKRGTSYSKIAAKLNEENVPTAHGGKWHAETIRHIAQAGK